jgi:hypothetical protein
MPWRRGVQWSSPCGTEDPVSNPAWMLVFWGKHCNATVYIHKYVYTYNDIMCIVCLVHYEKYIKALPTNTQKTNYGRIYLSHVVDRTMYLVDVKVDYNLRKTKPWTSFCTIFGETKPRTSLQSTWNHGHLYNSRTGRASWSSRTGTCSGRCWPRTGGPTCSATACPPKRRRKSSPSTSQVLPVVCVNSHREVFFNMCLPLRVNFEP